MDGTLEKVLRSEEGYGALQSAVILLESRNRSLKLLRMNFLILHDWKGECSRNSAAQVGYKVSMRAVL